MSVVRSLSCLACFHKTSAKQRTRCEAPSCGRMYGRERTSSVAVPSQSSRERQYTIPACCCGCAWMNAASSTSDSGSPPSDGVVSFHRTSNRRLGRLKLFCAKGKEGGQGVRR
jgi:hypothetical protein